VVFQEYKAEEQPLVKYLNLVEVVLEATTLAFLNMLVEEWGTEAVA